jgi:hypothetical protein
MDYSMFILVDGYEMPNIEPLERKWKIPMDDRVAWPFLPKGMLGPGDPGYRKNFMDSRAFARIATTLEQDRTADEVRQLEELLTRMDGRGGARYYEVGTDVHPRVSPTCAVVDGFMSGLIGWTIGSR